MYAAFLMIQCFFLSSGSFGIQQMQQYHCICRVEKYIQKFMLLKGKIRVCFLTSDICIPGSTQEQLRGHAISLLKLGYSHEKTEEENRGGGTWRTWCNGTEDVPIQVYPPLWKVRGRIGAILSGNPSTHSPRLTTLIGTRRSVIKRCDHKLKKHRITTFSNGSSSCCCC